ncbi:DUF262 domain-containing protein [Corallococcus macrosporus]|uniref:GmrSD restriction endonucleases N-terminal domain-containing protein n=1 Tax=Myxococcus fulvus (strain ATCC BAA-855 / HW-1) TaxID=483219 RepID=F8CDK3_MYXFH|nr:DUF262 domain-containing protein [Corallococcus macrosporus]AEI67310.1 hypothetical protein LILAB_27115 [Corallococcus macrosporus]
MLPHDYSGPEGLDDTLSAGWGKYPLDSVFVRTESRSVGEIVRRVNAGRYQLDPDFQRDFVWPLNKQSRLIESCLMRIPLPVFYVAEAMDGTIVVVDGLQRLTTLKRFLGDEFALSGLDDASVETKNLLTGKRFSELSINLQERIEDTQLILYVLDAKAPERARLDIFERVNSGVPLSRQQMRNCLYNGRATQWLKQAAESSEFLKATGGSLDKKSMRDREVINRFCAFHLLGYESYQSGDMDEFLARSLREINTMNEGETKKMHAQFLRAMANNHKLFQEHSFRRSLLSDGGSGRSAINIALYDVCSVLLSHYGEDMVVEGGEKIKSAVRKLLEDSDFVSAITHSTNSTKQVRARFTMMDAALKEALPC